MANKPNTLLKALQEIAGLDLFSNDLRKQANSAGNNGSSSIHQYRKRSRRE